VRSTVAPAIAASGGPCLYRRVHQGFAGPLRRTGLVLAELIEILRALAAGHARQQVSTISGALGLCLRFFGSTLRSITAAVPVWRNARAEARHLGCR
jgi:hypothetical protein